MYCINERWSSSNSKAGVFYAVTFKGHGTRHYYTVDDLQTAIDQANWNGLEILKAIRIENHKVTEFKPLTRAQVTEKENRAHCKHIAEELDNYASGNVKRCPECGATICRDWADVGNRFKCPECGEITEEYYMETLGVYDFLEDVYDIEYRITSNKELRSVQIMVACGGPNIYIDTATAQVELYWWTDRASYPISYDARDALDEWAEEMFSCL